MNEVLLALGIVAGGFAIGLPIIWVERRATRDRARRQARVPPCPCCGARMILMVASPPVMCGCRGLCPGCMHCRIHCDCLAAIRKTLVA